MYWLVIIMGKSACAAGHSLIVRVESATLAFPRRRVAHRVVAECGVQTCIASTRFSRQLALVVVAVVRGAGKARQVVRHRFALEVARRIAQQHLRRIALVTELRQQRAIVAAVAQAHHLAQSIVSEIGLRAVRHRLPRQAMQRVVVPARGVGAMILQTRQVLTVSGQRVRQSLLARVLSNPLTNYLCLFFPSFNGRKYFLAFVKIADFPVHQSPIE